MSEKTVQPETVEKALTALKNLASEDKISKSGPNTISSKVETMSGESGATQIYHTSSNSNPGTWAGSTQTDVPGNGDIKTTNNNPSGTDYAPGNVIKSVLELLKSGKISADAAQVILEKAMPFEKKDKDGDNDEDDDVKKGKGKEEKEEREKDDVSKSFSDNDVLRSGFEATEFLREFAGAVAKAIKTSQDQTVDRIVKAIEGNTFKSETFNKSLATAVANLGDALVAQAGRVEEIASAPARGPKSTQVSVLNKSFAGNTEPDNKLTKSQILKGMEDLVMKGQLHSDYVLRFEAGSPIEERVLRQVEKHLSGN